MIISRTTSPLAVLSASRPEHPVAVCALAVTTGDDKTRLIPGGTFDAPRGSLEGQGPWHLDAAGAAHVIQRAAARTTDIAIDYEHQILLADQNGQPAPASGWVDPRSLEWRDDGLYGRIQWTERAEQMIAAGEYRYLSPVFPYDPNTGAVNDLLHLALTNTPAIDDGIAELAAARRAPSTAAPQDEDSTVNREQLIKALGLKADATDEQIDGAIAALKAKAGEADGVRKALSLKDDDTPAEAVAALKAKADAKPAAGAEPDPAKFVPKAVYDEAVAALSAARVGEDQEMERLIDEGMKDGRIAGKATADWLKAQGLAALKAHLEDAPSIAALKGSTQTAGKAPQGDGEGGKGPHGLSDEELAVCKATDISPEDYRKANPVDDAE
ncbi:MULTISPECIES: phage protease [Halomonas]|uniref:Peptidase n=1 Tax=Halomonas halophila TaxID=29573 RepID=A0ABQ0TZM0_9GAMM|nr:MULTISPECIES: phage protease [Halomonas]MDR5889640.1 phage protease [Halomonas salina]WJY06322.1 phage protease [Halomonas halophila]GEK71591.1 peptidase [Halomonas halophila]